MAVKQWTQPDGKHFRGLCANEFWPVSGSGAGGCNVCISPMFVPRLGLCSCAANENSLARSLEVNIAVGPNPSGFFDFIIPSVAGDYSLRTVLESQTGEAVYDVNANSFLPNPTVPIIGCGLGAPIKMHEEGPFPPGLWSIEVGATPNGTGMFQGQKSWNGMIVSLTIRRWRQMTVNPLESQYVIDRFFAPSLWNYIAIGPHPRCEATFRSAIGGPALWFGGSSGAQSGNWIVTVTGGK